MSVNVTRRPARAPVRVLVEGLPYSGKTSIGRALTEQIAKGGARAIYRHGQMSYSKRVEAMFAEAARAMEQFQDEHAAFAQFAHLRHKQLEQDLVSYREELAIGIRDEEFLVQDRHVPGHIDFAGFFAPRLAALDLLGTPSSDSFYAAQIYVLAHCEVRSARASARPGPQTRFNRFVLANPPFQFAYDDAVAGRVEADCGLVVDTSHLRVDQAVAICLEWLRASGVIHDVPAGSHTDGI